jgi:hypothetical protein
MIALRKSSFIATALIVGLMGGCISVSIKNKDTTTTRSDKFKYSNPPSPFEKISSEQADLAWQNSKTGNTIAVLSECSETKDPSLSTLEGETIQALNSYQITKTGNIKFQERDALRSDVEGVVDGIAVRMNVLTFKKNSCAYTLTYLGRAKGFEKDLPAFDKFLLGFQAE